MSNVTNKQTRFAAEKPKVELIDMLECFPFNVGNALMHMYRAKEASGVSYQFEIEQAQFFLRREVRLSECPPGVAGVASLNNAATSFWFWFITQCPELSDYFDVAEVHDWGVDLDWDVDTLSLLANSLTKTVPTPN